MNADHWADQIAERLQLAGPDVLCLVPDDSTGDAIKRAFADACRLPPIISLSHLLEAAEQLPQQSLEALIVVARLNAGTANQGRHRRLSARLYEQLRDSGEQPVSARWRLANQLAHLLLELDDNSTLADTTNPLAKMPAPVSYEVQVATAIWDVLALNQVALSGRKKPILWSLVDRLSVPIVAIINDETPPLEIDFYEHCQATILRLQPPSPVQSLYQQLCRDGSDEPLVLSTLTGIEGCAETLTETAHVALDAIRYLLAETANDQQNQRPQRIGVVVYDRLLARRLRAIAEVNHILIKDNIGWRAETAAFGAALRTFVAIATGEIALDGMDSLLRPPFFADDAEVLIADHQWRRLAMTQVSLPADFAELAASAAYPLAKFAEQLDLIKQQTPKQATLSDWLGWLGRESATLLAAWRHDSIAKEYLNRLQSQGDDMRLLPAEFRLWLDDYLATENMTDNRIDSPVEFVSPTTRRRFSAILLLGYSQAASAEETGWLGEADRQWLGLSDHQARLDRQRWRFCRLMVAHQHVGIIWQRYGNNGEEQLPHPFWRLLADHLPERVRFDYIAQTYCDPSIQPPLPAQATLSRWPERLPLTAGENLMACPYRFFILNILHLEDDAVSTDGTLPAALTGRILHKVLHTFSQQTQTVSDDNTLRAAWQRSVQQEVAASNRPLLSLLAAHWLVQADAFLNWERQRRQQGWQAEQTEFNVGMKWLTRKQVVSISGRIDRIDSNDGGEWSMVDYKSGGLPSGKELQTGEHPQLSLYAYWCQILHDKIIKDKSLYKPMDKEVSDKANSRRVVARLRRVLQQIDRQVAMPANGIETACQRCSVIGICRRPHWSVAGEHIGSPTSTTDV